MLAVSVVRNAKHNPTVALRQDGRFDLAWPLRDEKQPDAIFAAFLRYPPHRFLGCLILGLAAVWHIPVSLFANEQNRVFAALVCVLPDFQIEQRASNDGA